MASSGMRTVNFPDGNGALRFTWEITSQSTTNNTSTIKWKLFPTVIPSWVLPKGNYSVTVNGVWTPGDITSKYEYASGTQTIKHDADGTKTFSYSFVSNCQYDDNNGNPVYARLGGEGTGTLNKITPPEPTPEEDPEPDVDITPPTLSSATNFTDRTNPTITYSNPMGSDVTSLQAGIFNTAGDTTYAAYRNISKTGTKYTFPLTDSEISKLEKALGSNKSLTVQFIVKSVINGTTYRARRNATFALANTSASVLSAPNFTDEDNPTITYSNPAGENATLLETCISFDGTKDDIPYRDIVDKTGSSFTFELTEEEREILRLGTLDGKNTRTVYFYIRSTINGNTTTHRLGKTLTIINAEPTMTEPAVIDMNDDTFALTNDRNTFIKGYSMAACQTHARPQKNATIVAYKFVNGSTVEERDEDLCAFANIETNEFELSATDNRGLTTTQTLTRTLIEYTKPTCIQEAEIELDPDVSSADQARIAITISGEFFNSTFGDAEGAVQNFPDVQIRHKIGEGEYSEWVSVSSVFWETYMDGNTYRTSGSISGLPYDKTITVQSRVVDSLESATTAEYPLKLDPVFHWSDKDFVFNVPVKFNAGFTSGDSTGDYVIETGTDKMGTNGTWYWRKWSSGRADCYGVRNFGNMACSTGWGSLYRSAIFTQDLPKYEDGSNIFKSAPDVITIDFSHGGMSAWVVKHEQTAPGADTTGSFMVVRAASATLSQVYLDFNIIGRWK